MSDRKHAFSCVIDTLRESNKVDANIPDKLAAYDEQIFCEQCQQPHIPSGWGVQKPSGFVHLCSEDCYEHWLDYGRFNYDPPERGCEE
jgi:hypothetical protein